MTDPTLTAGPLQLPLVDDPDGPRISGADPFLSALGWALDTLCADEAREAVARGEDLFLGPLEITAAAGELEEARAAWRERTGEELSEPAVSVRVGGSQAVLPRAVLVEAATQLAARKQTEAAPPPWLFTAAPRGDAPHASEREAVLALEAQDAPSEAALAERGLTQPERWAPKLRALLSWEAPRLATRYAERLGSSGPPHPPWLFTTAPGWELAHPSERARIAELDREAEAIEVVERDLDDAEEPPELIRHRARYLEQLRDAGLLSAEKRDAKLHQLHVWGATRLVGLYEAALRGLDYLQSAERAEYNPDAAGGDLLDAPVCLDIFRGLKTPEGVTPFAWISWGEHLLREHGPPPEVAADQGQFPYHDENGLVIVLWRRDARVPALRYIALKPPLIDTSLIREWLA